MSQALKILIVDDSAFMRLLISDLVTEDPDVEVAGTANDGLEAVEKVKELHPDVVIMDLNMGEYDGLYAVKAIMKDFPTPILILSSVGNSDLQPVFEALKAGAVDYMNKPNRNKSRMREISKELLQKVKSVSRAKPRRILDSAPEQPVRTASRKKKSKYEIIAIGASTGGPSAIERVLTVLPQDFDIPIIVCQHMPQAFIPPFVQRLNSITKLNVIAATKDMSPSPGTVMFCPGHGNLILKREEGDVLVDFTDKLFKEYNNPSVNAMIGSVAEVYGDKAVGVILTGMGKDGFEGLKNLHAKGGHIVAQNKETCVIYGMPKVVVEAGLADQTLDIKEIGNYLVKEI